MRDDPRVIRTMLQDRLSELLGRLLPGGRIDSGLYKAKNPTRDDRSAGSFVVWMSGPAKGGFKDYAGSDQDKGDIIDLISYVHRRPKTDRKFALQWARDFLGLHAMDPRAKQAAADAAKAKAAQTERDDKAAEQARRMRAIRLFDKALLLSDPAAEKAYRYFEAREIPLPMIPQLASDMRFMPSMEYWRGAEWDMRDTRRVKVAPGPSFPAIISAVRKGDGAIIAVHLTFLTPECTAKAPVEDAKLMFGSVAGGVIRLTNGPSGQTPEEAALSGRRDTLVIAEGIETALSVAIVAPEARVWAATSLSNIANVPVWHACVGNVVVAADNPNPKASPAGRAQAQEQLERAIDALRAHDVPVVVMHPHGDAGDFNDLIR